MVMLERVLKIKLILAVFMFYLKAIIIFSSYRDPCERVRPVQYGHHTIPISAAPSCNVDIT